MTQQTRIHRNSTLDNEMTPAAAVHCSKLLRERASSGTAKSSSRGVRRPKEERLVERLSEFPLDLRENIFSFAAYKEEHNVAIVQLERSE